MDLVRQMVGKYLSNPRSIILTSLTGIRAVVPANVDIATQEIIQMAEDADPLSQRTLGVLTKPNLVDKGAKDKVMELITNTKGKGRFKFGYTIVCNRSQSDLSITFDERNIKEVAFFNLNPLGLYSKAEDNLLINVTRRNFQGVSVDIRGRIRKIEQQLEIIGPVRQTAYEQRNHLINVALRFLSGAIINHGPNRNNAKVSRGRDSGMVTDKYTRSKGFEIGTTNPSLMPSLFAGQSRAWGFHAQNLITIVIHKIYHFNHKQASLVEVECHGNLITINHYFAENVRKAREARLKVKLEMLATWNTGDGRAEPLLRLNDILGVVLSNDDHTIQDLHDTLKSYYKVARKRFVDAICLQAVDHFLVSGKTSPLWGFSPHFIGKMSDAELQLIAGDEDKTVSRRNMLETELGSLKAGEKILET
ncbi:hypothetical protein BKA67DRAFT_540237 [Truncatella angustata]|uniref:GED domain-containing protein n=1 Tax=Truncatella angustata TaxID=152316 RepID=A0A9P8UBZ4_9PEZI|nr:uncharacterized protein BKA67DRAFT_540237 [Truncatella angustata]KAH6646742.1 hypothetical protein BKA67DRAFT_540237 [Truncatella angustata]